MVPSATRSQISALNCTSQLCRRRTAGQQRGSRASRDPHLMLPSLPARFPLSKPCENRAMPSIQGASHVAFTVRDMEASAEWYQQVFGWQLLRRYGADEAGTPRILLLDP